MTRFPLLLLLLCAVGCGGTIEPDPGPAPELCDRGGGEMGLMSDTESPECSRMATRKGENATWCCPEH